MTACLTLAQGLTDSLRSARGGSNEALGQLLDACRRYLHWVARRELDPTLKSKVGVSDCVQEAYLDAYRDFHQFVGDSETEFMAWLRRILLNNIANLGRHYRETAKRRIGSEVSLDAHASSEQRRWSLAAEQSSPCEQAMDNEEEQLLQEAISRLPETHRQILTLWQFEQLSFEEISRRMGCAPNTVRNRWFRAIQQLQGELE